jgi:hypothetical protein
MPTERGFSGGKPIETLDNCGVLGRSGLKLSFTSGCRKNIYKSTANTVLAGELWINKFSRKPTQPSAPLLDSEKPFSTKIKSQVRASKAQKLLT